MSLSLQEKQLLRSVVELILQNPRVAKRLFAQVKTANNLDFSSTIEKIKPLIFVVNNFEFESDDYLAKMSKAAAELRDDDAKQIVKSSMSGLKDRIYHNSLVV